MNKMELLQIFDDNKIAILCTCFENYCKLMKFLENNGYERFTNYWGNDVKHWDRLRYETIIIRGEKQYDNLIEKEEKVKYFYSTNCLSWGIRKGYTIVTDSDFLKVAKGETNRLREYGAGLLNKNKMIDKFESNEIAILIQNFNELRKVLKVIQTSKIFFEKFSHLSKKIVEELKYNCIDECDDYKFKNIVLINTINLNWNSIENYAIVQNLNDFNQILDYEKNIIKIETGVNEESTLMTATEFLKLVEKEKKEGYKMQENNKFNELETVKNVIEKNKNKGKSRADVYKSIVDDMFNIYLAKNNDYGNSFVKVREEFPSAICVRLSDKLERFKTLKKSKNQMVKDESIKDTLKDLANYAIMELVEIELNENVIDIDNTI